MLGPEGLQSYMDAWKEDLGRLEKCKKDLIEIYMPQVVALNAELTKALARISELEEEIAVLKEQ